MNIKNLSLTLLILLLSCSNFEMVLNESDKNRFLKNTSITISGDTGGRFSKGLFSFFGSSKENEYILITVFEEKKENRIVKNNQVAERVDYALSANYNIYYKTKNCKIFNKMVVTKFSFSPKSFGYNFGTERSLDKLYSLSVLENIQNFVSSAPKTNTCLL